MWRESFKGTGRCPQSHRSKEVTGRKKSLLEKWRAASTRRGSCGGDPKRHLPWWAFTLVAFSTGSGRKRFTTPTGVSSARRLPLGKDPKTPVCGPRWGQLEIASTTRCANRSLRHSNASLSSGSRSPIDRRVVAPSLTSLRDSTIRVDCTRPSTSNLPVNCEQEYF